MIDDPIRQEVVLRRREQRSEGRARSTFGAFVNEIADTGGLTRELAERAAVVVLGCLEQRITGTEVAHLESELPSMLRDILQEYEHHDGSPDERFGRAQFLDMVAEDLGIDPARSEDIVRAVLRTVRAHVSEGEARDIAAQLPADLARLWLDPDS